MAATGQLPYHGTAYFGAGTPRCKGLMKAKRQYGQGHSLRFMSKIILVEQNTLLNL
jgi:hypothetical protein